MPTYVYRVITPPADGSPPAEFELRQSINDPPLTHHPETGEPVARVIFPPGIARGALSNSQLNSAGFTKYAKMSDGTYEKQAGAGPGRINPHELG
jgi:hypothetical protein